MTRWKMTSGKNKQFFSYFFLILFGVFIGFILAEITVRLLDNQKIIHVDRGIASDMAIYSPSLIYKNKPYSTRTCQFGENNTDRILCHLNRFGFRDKDYAYTKRFNVCRIAILGDSMTYGLGASEQDTYPRILEQLINQNNKSGTLFEVMNMGTVGYGSAQYKNLYFYLAKKFNPDLILIGLHLQTDPFEALYQEKNKTYIVLKALPDTLIPYAPHQFIKDHSLFWLFFLQQYYGFVQRFQQDWTEILPQMGADSHIIYHTQIDRKSPVMGSEMDLTEEAIDAITADAGDQNVNVVTIGIPAKEQIIPDAWKELQKKDNKVTEIAYTHAAARTLLLEQCKRNQWYCLDLQDPLRKHNTTSSLFIPNDFHFTREGNSTAARAIYTYLFEKNLLHSTSRNCSYDPVKKAH